MNQTKRIQWIDALRGFTMILVVYSHVHAFGFEGTHSIANNFFFHFRMPLFFFISGYIAYRANELWDFNHFKTQMLKKMRIQIIPTLFFGLLFTILVFQFRYDKTLAYSIDLFINDPAKLGYWFTIALLMMFIIYYTVSFLLSRCKLSTRQIVLAVIALIMYLATLACKSFFQHKIAYWLCFINVFQYFQFFVFGNIFACYQKQLFKFLQKPHVIGFIILSFIGLYIVNRFLKDSSLINTSLGKTSSKLIVQIIRYCGILSIVCAFRHYENFFSTETRIGRGLQYIGKRTLDVYLLHYFLIPELPTLGRFFSSTYNIVLETSCTVFVALLVILFCLIISNFLRTSSFLAYYLFGAKPAQKEPIPDTDNNQKQ